MRNFIHKVMNWKRKGQVWLLTLLHLSFWSYVPWFVDKYLFTLAGSRGIYVLWTHLHLFSLSMIQIILRWNYKVYLNPKWKSSIMTTLLDLFIRLVSISVLHRIYFYSVELFDANIICYFSGTNIWSGDRSRHIRIWGEINYSSWLVKYHGNHINCDGRSKRGILLDQKLITKKNITLLE